MIGFSRTFHVLFACISVLLIDDIGLHQSVNAFFAVDYFFGTDGEDVLDDRTADVSRGIYLENIAGAVGIRILHGKDVLEDQIAHFAIDLQLFHITAVGIFEGGKSVNDEIFDHRRLT